MAMLLGTKYSRSCSFFIRAISTLCEIYNPKPPVSPMIKTTLVTPKPTTLFRGVPHMKGGTGDTSYAKNSSLQKNSTFHARPILQESIREMMWALKPKCLKYADLGCSSGPNSFSTLKDIIENAQMMGQGPTEVQAFLNDLPGNDFNSLFSLLTPFRNGLGFGPFGPCFVGAVAGSFYGRLFPTNSIHLFHSSFSVNWLSQVPKRLVSENGAHLNKGNICMAVTSPIAAREAYTNQFETDFFDFLKSRSQELTRGGRMVIVMMGSNDNLGHTVWELLGSTLNDMVSEGLVGETTLDSFDMPIHFPCRDEVTSVVRKEGSFRVHRLETLRLNWDGDKINDGVEYDNVERGKQVSVTLRAVGEPMFESHFGREVTDSLFRRHSEKVADYLERVGEGVFTSHVVSLIKD